MKQTPESQIEINGYLITVSLTCLNIFCYVKFLYSILQDMFDNFWVKYYIL